MKVRLSCTACYISKSLRHTHVQKHAWAILLLACVTRNAHIAKSWYSATVHRNLWQNIASSKWPYTQVLYTWHGIYVYLLMALYREAIYRGLYFCVRQMQFLN